MEVMMDVGMFLRYVVSLLFLTLFVLLPYLVASSVYAALRRLLRARKSVAMLAAVAVIVGGTAFWFGEFYPGAPLLSAQFFWFIPMLALAAFLLTIPLLLGYGAALLVWERSKILACLTFVTTALFVYYWFLLININALSWLFS